MKIRLEKFMSSQNFGTKKEVKKIIKSGCITVDTKVIKDCSFKIDPLINKVKHNNSLIKYKQFVYIALNKPKNYVCASKDDKSSTVFDLIDKYKNINLHTVGRLDKNTTGLILITNDGEWSHQLKGPKSNTEKEYKVSLKKPLDDIMITKLKSEMILNNKVLKPIKLTKIDKKTCNIILTEGKYHQIKRMFHQVNNEVLELERIRIGKFNLKELNISLGEWKEIDVY